MNIQSLIRWIGFASLLAIMALDLAQCGSAPKPALGNDVIASIDPVTRAGSFKTPLDSTPDPDGNTIGLTPAPS